MKRMNWSYSDLMALPVGYLDPLYKLLREEAREHARANRRRR